MHIRIDSGRYLGGLLIVGLGTAWLLDNLNIINVNVWDLLWRWWPAILIYLGVAGALSALTRSIRDSRPVDWGSVVGSGILAGIGLIVLGNINGWLSISIGQIFGAVFAVILIAFGVGLVFGGTRTTSDRSTWAVMSHSRLTPTGFEPVSVTALMGGIDLDLTQMAVPEGYETVVDITAIMGGAKILVPPDVEVTCQYSGAMGGVDFFGRGMGGAGVTQTMTAGTGPKILVRVKTIMGGVKFAYRSR